MGWRLSVGGLGSIYGTFKGIHKGPFKGSYKGSTGFRVWEFPKIRCTLFWGPYNKDPTI